MILSLPAWAATQIHRAPINEAGWELEVSRLQCRLLHVIPGYGTAEFSQRAQGSLVFRIQVLQPALQAGSARLWSLPGSWRHFTQPRDLGPLPIIAGEVPFFLGEHAAQRLLAELEAGMTPSLEYQDWVDGVDRVSVRILPVGLNELLGGFHDCRRNLLTVTAEEVSDKVLLYGFNQVELDANQKRQLGRMIKVLKHDDNYRQLKVEGYTDSLGLERVNLAIARQRVEAVKAYLVSNGIPAERIATRSHPESAAKFTNQTEEGRRQNRRVEVTLVR